MIGKNFYTVKPKNLEHLTVVQKKRIQNNKGLLQISPLDFDINVNLVFGLLI